MNYAPIQNAHAVNHLTHQKRLKKMMIRLNKRILLFLCVFILLASNVKASSLEDIPVDKVAHFGAGYIIQDQLERNAGMGKLEAFLTTTAIAWAKEKYLDKNVDNDDAYATMAGALFYQVEF